MSRSSLSNAWAGSRLARSPRKPEARLATTGGGDQEGRQKSRSTKHRDGYRCAPRLRRGPIGTGARDLEWQGGRVASHGQATYGSAFQAGEVRMAGERPPVG